MLLLLVILTDQLGFLPTLFALQMIILSSKVRVALTPGFAGDQN